MILATTHITIILTRTTSRAIRRDAAVFSTAGIGFGAVSVGAFAASSVRWVTVAFCDRTAGYISGGTASV